MFRKRERLTNLTKEEKLHRRKLKNRVAAQTARDRKKEKSIRLEKTVRILLHETTLLRAANANLQRELAQLKASQQVGLFYIFNGNTFIGALNIFFFIESTKPSGICSAIVATTNYVVANQLFAGNDYGKPGVYQYKFYYLFS